MKKTLMIIIIIFFVLIINIYFIINNAKIERKNIAKENAEYEYYLNKEILGTEVATLIDKVIDINEKNKIKKDDKNYYIENNSNSILIELKMKTIDKTYAMEEFYNHNMVEFVKHFNLSSFKCTSIKYHTKTGKVRRLLFEEI